MEWGQVCPLSDPAMDPSGVQLISPAQDDQALRSAGIRGMLCSIVLPPYQCWATTLCLSDCSLFRLHPNVIRVQVPVLVVSVSVVLQYASLLGPTVQPCTAHLQYVRMSCILQID
jgi:hypothetical protein